ncbi:MAG TPA: DinB family protein [Pyrinomonadaceae bacterium]
MMNYARRTTLDEVEGLSVEQLDYLHDAHSNSIGALLLHVAAVEAWYQEATFGTRAYDDGGAEPWEAALDLGERSRREVKGRGVDFYLRALERVRAKTLEELALRDDRWLDEEAPFWEGQPANNYFKWFHVFEDEINHRGQIRWLRKRAAGA